MKNPDVIIFDFSNNSWHIGLEDAIKLANAYPDAKLILSHWGSVDAPEMDAFNADPAALIGKVINEDRIYIMAPGEAFKL
jgi:predicted TIM-barrel fold metal-dependent hydrolase